MISGELSDRVLVLCHANVCRSPLAAFVLAQRLEPRGWIVESRGTHARDGVRMCRVGSRVVAAAGGADYLENFSSRRVTPSDLRASIILTASAAEKSELAILDPSTRRKTFTLREAALLADLDATPAEGLALAERWDALRRSGAIADASSRGELDIPDVHQQRWGRHAPVVSAVVEAAERLTVPARSARRV